MENLPANGVTRSGFVGLVWGDPGTGEFFGVAFTMLRHSFKAFICIGALCAAAPAIAADAYPPGPPPPPAPVQIVDNSSNCFYVRADVGGAFHEKPAVSRSAVGAGGGFGGGGLDADGETIRDTAFFEGGVGCQLTSNMRVEVTGGYRLRQSLRDSFDTLDAELQTYTAFANVYYDITNYAGWTPYLGGGMGVAVHSVRDVVAPVSSSSGEEVDFAWNIQAGVSYDFTQQAKLDFGYRLTDLGKAKSGGPIPFTVDNLMAHEFRVGLRFHFGG